MQYDAIILAGGKSSRELKSVAPYANEALIVIGKFPMIYYVYKALRASALIRNIVVSGPIEALKNGILPQDKQLFYVESGRSAIESFAHGADFLKKVGITPKILVLPTDIPFITCEAIEDFLQQCEKYPADFYYPVTSKEINDQKFPGVERTYVHLKEGCFTGGNLFLIDKSIIDKCLDMGLKLEKRRKKPVAMARLFGFKLLLTYLFNQLSIGKAEERFFEVMGFRGKGIISNYAEVGVDIDKPSDLEIAQKYFWQMNQ